MAENKTKETDINVTDFINSYVENEVKRQDSFKLVEMMKTWSGYEPKMWGPTIIGFGSYHYKYASGHEGDAAIIAFSPRKAEFSLYVYSPTEASETLLPSLGKFKMGKMCIYVKKLADIDLNVLEKLCRESISYIEKHHECGCKN
jgi:hypothetical protein